jgi:hypothetical protein
MVLLNMFAVMLCLQVKHNDNEQFNELLINEDPAERRDIMILAIILFSNAN